MEVQEAESTVKQLVAEFAAYRELAADSARRASAISKILAGYVEMFPELERLVEGQALPTYATDGTPRGTEAARIILQERPDYWFWVSEVLTALKERGWLPDSDNPANAVRTALERLVNTPGSDVHKGRGTDGKVAYSYRPDDEPPDDQPQTIRPSSYDDEDPF